MFYNCYDSQLIYMFSKQSATVQPEPTPIPDSSSVPTKTHSGDNPNDLEQIEVKLDKTSDEQSTINQKSPSNNKHSPANNQANSAASGGFSLKNPVSSFRSWVSNKKTSKDDSTRIEQSPSATYEKIDTSPTPRKSSIESDTTKRNRTNSATTTNNHQETSTNQKGVKKKSSFSIRSNNQTSLLKRAPETTNDNESNEQTGTGHSSGAFGYLKNLVRGEKQ